ncbi:MAG: GFA family protein [Geminicoccaceae bacterium]
MAGEHVPVTGGCLCGAVRFASGEPPVQGFYCHCGICRKSYGGLYQATVKFTASAFAFTRGRPRYYRSSGFARRGFCAACGSPLVFRYAGNPATWVLIGSLDHPEDWPLTGDATWGRSAHWYVETKVPWHKLDDGLPLHGEAPGAAAAQRHAAAHQTGRP